MKSKIIKRSIFLIPTPDKGKTLGLEVRFNPSIYWSRKHNNLEPGMRTDIVKGQQEYILPKYFRVGRITDVIIV